MYGPPPAYVRGKLTAKKVSRAQFSEELKSDVKVQTMYADVMEIDRRKFLLCVLDPLQLTLVTYVKDEGEESLGLAMQSHLQTLKERGFSATVVHTDRHATFLKLRTSFPGTRCWMCRVGAISFLR